MPDELRRAADRLAGELGTTRNDALIRLATAGAAVVANARDVSEIADARWHGFLAAMPKGSGDFPSLEEMEEWALALRREG